ncbi:MAG: hypothetical protein ACXAEN_25910 [Candidatus Thorarchaeota archaeon]|jgi:hypothetical protein
MSTSVTNLSELLQALDDGGALTYVDCGTYAKIHFDKSVDKFGDDVKPTARDIRFLDPVSYADDFAIEVETGMCGTLVDVYLTKRGADDDEPPYYGPYPDESTPF